MSAARPAVGRRTIVCLGISQLVCWGISYYLIGVFGELIAADLGWSRTLVYGGFSTRCWRWGSPRRWSAA